LEFETKVLCNKYSKKPFNAWLEFFAIGKFYKNQRDILLHIRGVQDDRKKLYIDDNDDAILLII
jgi:hypothetical protein